MIKFKNKLINSIILDLDGVLTDTASLHTDAWEQMFNSYLKKLSQETDSLHRPFDPFSDYLKYLDGRPRYDGAKSFLSSRGIDLPLGSPDNPPGEETICALANRKNEIYHSLLETKGVESFEDARDKLKQWTLQGYKLAVISASKNCRKILKTTDLEKFFPVIIDGNDAVSMKLRGKPYPDLFIAAAHKLNVKPADTAIIEDAPAGVKAGRKGDFALVIGISRKGQSSKLLFESGAEMVISTLWDIPDNY